MPGMTTASLLAFLLASFLLAIVPGVGTAMLVKQGVRGGRRAARGWRPGSRSGPWPPGSGSRCCSSRRRAARGVADSWCGRALWFETRALFSKAAHLRRGRGAGDTLRYLIIATPLTTIIGWLKRHQHKLERISGGVLIGLGIKLALDS
jgi:hypothetical protein